jgi:large subunit ribosomal protein L24
MAQRIKKGDLVEVITGAQGPRKGKAGAIGKVLRIDLKTNRVLVEGVNRVWKHVKPSQKFPQGGRLQKEAPIAISNVLPVDPSTGRGTRVKFEERDGKKTRVAVKSGTALTTSSK